MEAKQAAAPNEQRVWCRRGVPMTRNEASAALCISVALAWQKNYAIQLVA